MINIYRNLLRLYPSGFRTEYGPELCAIFESRLERSSGPLAPLILIIAALGDVIWNAMAAHFDILRQDIRYTARALRRSPGFTFTAIAVVALGVGANTAAFSLADFVLLRPLPYPDSNRLVKLWQSSEAFTQNEVSPANYRDWKAMTISSSRSSFREMGAYTRRSVNLVGEGQPRRLQSVSATDEVLRLVGVPAMIGRIMTASDNAAGATAVISHELWRSHFGADPGVIGRAVRLDGSPYTIIGVMPPTFHFPSRDIELWTPLTLSGEDFEDRNDTYLEVVARLAPDATVDGAIAEMKTVAARLEQQYPAENEDVGVLLHRLKDQLSRSSRVLILALCGASLCILLLACANLASLLLARGIGRTRELAVRNTLGAGRDRLVRQFITESLALAFMGGLVGVATAMAGLPLLARLVPTGLPIGEVPTVDVRVLAFAALLIGLTGLGFGVAPALRAGKSGALEALREAGRSAGGRRQRMRSTLVILQVTGSIVLLISSGLLMRAVWRIQSIEPGFDAESVMTLRTALPLPKYAMTADRERFYRRVLDDVRALPGIESAAYITGLPMDKRGGIWPVVVGGANSQRTQSNSASLRYVSAGFFKTLGIPIRRGRDIAQTDTGDHPYIAVVSESFVQRHWPGQDPIGRQFGFALNDRTVVGVVGDVRVRGLEQSSEPQVYLPSGQVPDNSLIGYVPQDLVIRSTLAADGWLPSVRRIITAADPEQPVSNIRPVSEIVADDIAPRRVQLILLTILAALALVIAGVGIHGLLSFTVSQRTQELGIRRALGAQAGTIVSMVLREGIRVAVVGTLIGVAVAVMVGRGMSALLFGVAPGDPQTIAAAVALCFLTVLVGCLRPALRAARVDPITALREGGG